MTIRETLVSPLRFNGLFKPLDPLMSNQYRDKDFLFATPRRACWASYQIRRIARCACAGNDQNVFPATNFKGNR